MPLAIGDTVDRYLVEAELGSGGMARVYRVRHRTLGTEHALKVLTLHSDSLRARSVQEARMQAAIRHPNVVAVSDVIDVNGAPGLLMDYVAGPTLHVWLSQTVLSGQRAEAIFREIVAGVAAAHKLGLVHRDLKPANILIDDVDGRPVPRVTDFGIAKVLDPERRDSGMTSTGIGMGTPAYMAPEQFRNAKTVDQRADLFSLGCVAYHMVCGHPPFEDKDHYLLVARELSGDYRRPEDFRRDLPTNLVDAINGCLVGKVELRVASCEELTAILDGQNTPHRPRPVSGAPAYAGPARAPGASDSPTGLAGRWSQARELSERTLYRLMDPTRLELLQAQLRRRDVQVGLVVIAALLLVLLVVLWRPSAPPSVAELTVEPVTEPVAEPVAEPIAEPVAEPVVEPVADPVEAPIADPGSPAAPGPDESHVVVVSTRDVLAVWLVSQATGKRHAIEGTVTLPKGSYKIEAEFTDVGKMLAGQLILEGGDRVRIKCSPRLLMCRR